MHHILLIILRELCFVLYGAGVVLTWLGIEKEKQHPIKHERWFSRDTPKWKQLIASIGWPAILALLIVSIPIFLAYDTGRWIVRQYHNLKYRITHRKEIKTRKAEAKRRLEEQKRWAAEQAEANRKWMEQEKERLKKIEEQRKREEHAEKYL